MNGLFMLLISFLGWTQRSSTRGINSPGWMQVERSQRFTLRRLHQAREIKRGTWKVVSKYLTDPPVKVGAIPISRLPAISSKFSQRIAAVLEKASTLLFLNPPVLLKIYLRLWAV